MQEEILTEVIEAILFLEPEGLSIKELAQRIDTNVRSVQASLDVLEQKYVSGVRILRSKSHCSFIASEKIQTILQSIYKEKPEHISKHLLEILSMIAYTQPTTKASLEQLRGGSCSYAIQKLLKEEYIRKVGKKDVPGNPFLYSVTQKFLTRFSLRSIEDLPPLDAHTTNLLNGPQAHAETRQKKSTP